MGAEIPDGGRSTRGEQTLAQQALRFVKVRYRSVEQRRALAHRSFDRRPFLVPDYKRQRIERPLGIGAARISIHMVGNTVVAEQATSFLPSASEPWVPSRQWNSSEIASARGFALPT